MSKSKTKRNADLAPDQHAALDQDAALHGAPSLSAKVSRRKAAQAMDRKEPAAAKRKAKTASKAKAKAQDRSKHEQGNAWSAVEHARPGKRVRDSFSMPAEDFALIAQLKERALLFHRPTKKSELLRAGLQLLANLELSELQEALAQLQPRKSAH